MVKLTLHVKQTWHIIYRPKIVPRRNSTPSFLHWRENSTPLFCTCGQIVPRRFEHRQIVPRRFVHVDKEYSVDLWSIHDVMKTEIVID